MATSTSLTVQLLALATVFTALSDTGSDHATALSVPAAPVQIVTSLRVPSSSLRAVSTSPGAAERTSTTDPPPGSAERMVVAMPDPAARAAATTESPAPTGLRSANRPNRPACRNRPGAETTSPSAPETRAAAAAARLPASTAPDRTRVVSGCPGGCRWAPCWLTPGPSMGPPCGLASNRLIASCTIRIPSAMAWWVRSSIALPLP